MISPKNAECEPVSGTMQEDQAEGAAPVPNSNMVAKGIYASSYYLAFSVVYPPLLLANMLPKSSVGRGLTDGAKAAQHSNELVRATVVKTTTATLEKVGDAYTGVAVRVSERMEGIQDTIAERRYHRRAATA